MLGPAVQCDTVLRGDGGGEKLPECYILPCFPLHCGCGSIADQPKVPGLGLGVRVGAAHSRCVCRSCSEKSAANPKPLRRTPREGKGPGSGLPR